MLPVNAGRASASERAVAELARQLANKLRHLNSELAELDQACALLGTSLKKGYYTPQAAALTQDPILTRLQQIDSTGKTVLKEFETYTHTPMHLAAQYDLIPLMQWLHWTGSPVDALSSGVKGGEVRPLFLACLVGNLNAVRALLNMPGVDASAIAEDRESPLYLMCQAIGGNESKKRGRIALALVAAGADPFVRNAQGPRPKDLESIKTIHEAYDVSYGLQPSSPLSALPFTTRLRIYRKIDPQSLFVGYGRMTKGARAELIADLIRHLKGDVLG